MFAVWVARGVNCRVGIAAGVTFASLGVSAGRMRLVLRPLGRSPLVIEFEPSCFALSRIPRIGGRVVNSETSPDFTARLLTQEVVE